MFFSYGTSMSEPLPMAQFTWMTTEELDQLDVTTIADDAQWGYVLEIDLEYPPEIHQSHSDYPLAVQKMKVDQADLSQYSRDLKEKLGLRGPSTTKLVPNLRPKEKYVAHYRNIKFYAKQGLKITRIHRGIKFIQKPWLKAYIDKNTELRRLAKCEFEKNLYKLFNNAIYG